MAFDILQFLVCESMSSQEGLWWFSRFMLIMCVLSRVFYPNSVSSLFHSVSSLAWFMSNQETSFVTLGQRVLAYPLKWVILFVSHVFNLLLNIPSPNYYL